MQDNGSINTPCSKVRPSMLKTALSGNATYSALPPGIFTPTQ